MNGRSLTVLSFALLLSGCSGESLTPGLDEPLRVDNGQFRKGVLPGSAPVPANDDGSEPPLIEPAVTSAGLANFVVRSRQTGTRMDGRASSTAVAVGMRFRGIGSGYWVLPLSAPDPFNNNEFSWLTDVTFGDHLPIGRQKLAFVAIDHNGRAGAQRDVDVCVVPEIPDNLNACDAKRVPPQTIVSLNWDSAVDLDLRVVTPSGKVVDAKSITTATGDAGTSTPQVSVGLIDRDSNADCHIDGIRRENLIWQQKPESGRYKVYANLFDACAASAVRFNVTLLQSSAAAEPGTFKLVEVYKTSGELSAIEANGGAKIGMFVTEFVIN